MNTRHCPASCRIRAAHRRKTASSSPKAGSDASSLPTHAMTPTFVKVHLTEGKASLESSGPDLEVLLCGGHRLKAPKDFDAVTLSRLVLTLETLRC